MKTHTLLATIVLGGAIALCRAADVQWLVGGDINIEGSLGAAVQAKNGALFVGSTDGILRAFSKEGSLTGTGKAKPQDEACLAIDSAGVIYQIPGDDYIYAMTPSGAVKWSLNAGAKLESSVAIGKNGDVYVPGAALIAIKPDGQVRWRVGEISGGYAPAVGPDATVYSASSDGNVYAVSADGTLKWKCPIRGAQVDASLAIDLSGNIRTELSADRGIVGISRDGSIQWETPIAGKITSSIIVDDHGCAYFGTDGGELYCLDSNGTVRWRAASGRRGSVNSAVIDAKRNVHFEVGATLYSVSSEGVMFQTHQLRAGIGALMLTDDGWIVAGTWAGVVRVYVGSAPLPNCWAMDRCNAQRSACLDGIAESPDK